MILRPVSSALLTVFFYGDTVCSLQVLQAGSMAHVASYPEGAGGKVARA
jgi:hypothetical protein